MKYKGKKQWSWAAGILFAISTFTEQPLGPVEICGL